jgi:Tfp pilus assembly protein PilN
VRPVNLLPARYRPRTGASADSKTTYIALGVLGLLVLAVFGYVMSANKVSAANSEIAQTRQQIAAAEAQAVTLQGFGSFAAVKEARLSAVKSLASTRLDWERLFRELAHVLPQGVWLTGFDGQPGDDGASGGGTLEGGPTVLLSGCAESHRQVADVMVRLRELHVAEDVELTKTSAGDEADEGAAVVPGAAPAASGDSAGGCAQYYTFEIKITLAAAGPELGPAPATVPARLGGGQ